METTRCKNYVILDVSELQIDRVGVTMKQKVLVGVPVQVTSR